MKPLVVEMQAFGPFADRQVIDFRELGSKTFFLIHGPTGSGKTLAAIALAVIGMGLWPEPILALLKHLVERL